MQKEIGLKTVQQIYFNSLFIHDKFFILPGGKLIFLIIFINLIFKIFKDKIKNPNTFLIHFGFLLFLCFSFLSINNYNEKYLIIKEGETKNTILNNNSYKINIYIGNLNKTFNIYANDIKKYNIIQLNDRFYLKILDILPNSEVEISNKLNANFFNFKNIPFFVESSYDKFSLIFEIHDTITNTKQILFLIENIFEFINTTSNEIKYSISLKKLEEPIPFDFHLIKFDKINYLGTLSAKNFKSEIIITDKGINHVFEISMNKPLKYKNYTFYQSSYIEETTNYSSIFNIKTGMQNHMAYISLLISFIGMIINIFFILFKKNRSFYE